MSGQMVDMKLAVVCGKLFFVLQAIGMLSGLLDLQLGGATRDGWGRGLNFYTTFGEAPFVLLQAELVGTAILVLLTQCF